jgi:DNA polymerase-3 subunit epsilon
MINFNDKLNPGLKILFLDLETTGTKFWRNGIHQISGIIDINGEVRERFDFKVKPFERAEIEDSALEVAKVTREQILSYPETQTVYNELLELILKYVDRYKKNDKLFIVGFNNAAFDNSFFRAFFVQNKDTYFGSYFWPNPVDVYCMASVKLLYERHKMPDFKLMSVARRFGIEINEDKLHDAIYDVEVTRDIYYKIVSPGLRGSTDKNGAVSFIDKQDDDFLLPFDKPGDMYSKTQS